MSLTVKHWFTKSKEEKAVAYKEMKLNPGEAKDLNALWNASMDPKKKSGKKPMTKKKEATDKKSANKNKK